MKNPICFTSDEIITIFHDTYNKNNFYEEINKNKLINVEKQGIQNTINIDIDYDKSYIYFKVWHNDFFSPLNPYLTFSIHFDDRQWSIIFFESTDIKFFTENMVHPKISCISLFHVIDENCETHFCKNNNGNFVEKNFYKENNPLNQEHELLQGCQFKDSILLNNYNDFWKSVICLVDDKLFYEKFAVGLNIFLGECISNDLIKEKGKDFLIVSIIFLLKQNFIEYNYFKYFCILNNFDFCSKNITKSIFLNFINYILKQLKI